VKLFNNNIAEWMGSNRIKMAEDIGASMLITACPWCEWNFQDTVTTTDGLVVKNIITLLKENM